MKLLAAVLVLLSLAACAPQGRFERAGANVDEKIDDVRDGAEDVVEDARETAEDIGDSVERRRRR